MSLCETYMLRRVTIHTRICKLADGHHADAIIAVVHSAVCETLIFSAIKIDAVRIGRQQWRLDVQRVHTNIRTRYNFNAVRV